MQKGIPVSFTSSKVHLVVCLSCCSISPGEDLPIPFYSPLPSKSTSIPLHHQPFLGHPFTFKITFDTHSPTSPWTPLYLKNYLQLPNQHASGEESGGWEEKRLRNPSRESSSHLPLLAEAQNFPGMAGPSQRTGRGEAGVHVPQPRRRQT